RMVDLVNEIEKIVGGHPLLDHNTPHRGAIAPVEILLLAEGIVIGGVEEFCDVVANAFIDLLPEVEVMRVERVVEVEHPGVDVSKGPGRGVRAGQGGWGHGGFRSVLVPAGVVLPRVPQPPPVRSLMSAGPDSL